MPSKLLLYAWYGVLILLVISGIYYLHAYYYEYEAWETKDIIPWGLLVPSYVYFALASTGSSIINSLYTVFGYKGPNEGFEKIIKHGVWFSLITIIPAWTMIILDLGRPDHFLSMLTSFNIVSRIAWMGVLYSFFFLMLLIELVYFIRSEVNEKLKHWKALELAIAILVLFATIAVHSNLGEVFGSSTGVPAWYGPHVGAYFIASAVLIGSAWQLFFVSIVYKAKGGLSENLKEFFVKVYNKIFIIGIPVLAFFVIWNLIVAYYYPPAWEAYKHLLYGEFSKEFIIVEVIIGLIVTFIVAVYSYIKKNFLLTFINSIILIIVGYISKFDFIISGEIARLSFNYGGLTNNLNPYYVRFWPFDYDIGLPEKMMLVLAVSIWLILLTLGEQILPLERGEKPKKLFVFK
ncbi:MAG: polysulfide reductase NrfD [Desulfurococcales archaeon]|nr:polysulfide reductase NrfD [Desulfurococcales archaeon]MEB3788842.1 polysulfide reductase NrfD [Desulfurococcales archaeon]